MNDSLETFLRTILADLEKLAAATPPGIGVAYDEGYYLAGAVSHAKQLVAEEARIPPKRTNSIIKSSWRTVNAAGRRYGLFKRFEGQEHLREALRVFLESGYKLGL